MTERDEAHRLAQLFDGRPIALVTFLSGQLSVLKSQAQMQLGLCGLAVTVTGFSGSHMIRAGALSSWCLVIGIWLILIAAVLGLRSLGNIRWVTQDLTDDLSETACRVLKRRNQQQRQLVVSAVFVALGLTAYLGSVMVAALHLGNA